MMMMMMRKELVGLVFLLLATASQGYSVSSLRPRRCSRRMAKEPLGSDMEESVSPKFRRRSDEKTTSSKPRARMSTVNEKLLADIEAAKSSVRKFFF